MIYRGVFCGFVDLFVSRDFKGRDLRFRAAVRRDRGANGSRLATPTQVTPDPLFGLPDPVKAADFWGRRANIVGRPKKFRAFAALFEGRPHARQRGPSLRQRLRAPQA